MTNPDHPCYYRIFKDDGNWTWSAHGWKPCTKLNYMDLLRPDLAYHIWSIFQNSLQFEGCLEFQTVTY
jgi:hypothetical protein